MLFARRARRFVAGVGTAWKLGGHGAGQTRRPAGTADRLPLEVAKEGDVTRIAFAAVVMALSVSAGCASMDAARKPSAEGTIDKIKATKTVRFGYRESSVPFSFVGPDKKAAGYSVELCTRVAADLQRQLQIPDLQVTWVPVTVESRIPAVLDGRIDLECGSTTNTLSRQEQVDFSLTTFVTGGSLLGLSGATLGTDLRGVRIGVITGTTTEQVLREALARGASNAVLVPVKDHAEGLAAVENRSVDAYASDRVILIGLAAASQDPSRFALADFYFSYEPYALMMRRGDPAFRLAVNRVLARLYRSGQIQDVYTRWFGKLGVPGSLLVAMFAIEGLPE
jgi:glutamate/aspartate transport system substrate-binding protein